LETGISLINFMPCSEAEIGKIRCVQELRRATKGTWTQVNERKVYRAPRCPQGTYERTLMLYTTYAMFLEMLFSKANAHLVGINHIRWRLMSMAKILTRLSPWYFANVTWEVLEDAFKHFSKNTELEDFKVQDPLSGVIWPSSSLLGTATQMAGGTMIDYLGMPDEWRNMLNGPNVNTPWNGMGHWGGHTTVSQGNGGDGAPYQQGVKGAAHTVTAGGSNTHEFRPDTTERTNKRKAELYRSLHPERYGREGDRNTNMSGILCNLFRPITTEVYWKQMFAFCGSSFTRLARWKGYDHGICPRFLCGYCPIQSCNAAHLYAKELPRNYPMIMHDDMKSGVSKYIQNQEGLDDGNEMGKGKANTDRNGGNDGQDGSGTEEPPAKF